jgi:hypothetical protein
MMVHTAIEVSPFMVDVNVKVQHYVLVVLTKPLLLCTYNDVQQQWDRLIDSRFMLGKRIVNELTSWPPVKMLSFSFSEIFQRRCEIGEMRLGVSSIFVNQVRVRDCQRPELVSGYTHTRVERWRRNRRCQTGQWAIGLQLSSFPERDLMVIHIQKRKAAAVWLMALSSLWFWWNFQKKRKSLLISTACVSRYFPAVCQVDFGVDPSFWAHTPPP